MQRKDHRLLTETELAGLQMALPEWKRVGAFLECWQGFPSFPLAMEFVRRVAEVAEELDHHPDIDIRYRRVCVRLTTYSAGGLTSLDVEAAGRISALPSEAGKGLSLPSSALPSALPSA